MRRRSLAPGAEPRFDAARVGSRRVAFGTPMPHFAANLTLMFGEWDFLDRFAAAADAGFDAVEILFPYDVAPDELARLLNANRLTPALFNMPCGDYAKGERGLAVFPERRAEFRASVDRALDYAQATGVKRLHMLAGIAPSSSSPAEASFCDSVREAAEKLHARGVELMLEPLNPRGSPGYFLNDFDQTERIIRDLALPNVKLQFDVYHCQIVHGDVTIRLRAQAPLIGHVQISSVPDRQEPDSGELNDSYVLAELERLGYAGFVGCEYRPRAGTIEGLGWMEKWKK